MNNFTKYSAVIAAIFGIELSAMDQFLVLNTDFFDDELSSIKFEESNKPAPLSVDSDHFKLICSDLGKGEQKGPFVFCENEPDTQVLMYSKLGKGEDTWVFSTSSPDTQLKVQLIIYQKYTEKTTNEERFRVHSSLQETDSVINYDFFNGKDTLEKTYYRNLNFSNTQPGVTRTSTQLRLFPTEGTCHCVTLDIEYEYFLNEINKKISNLEQKFISFQSTFNVLSEVVDGFKMLSENDQDLSREVLQNQVENLESRLLKIKGKHLFDDKSLENLGEKIDFYQQEVERLDIELYKIDNDLHNKFAYVLSMKRHAEEENTDPTYFRQAVEYVYQQENPQKVNELNFYQYNDPKIAMIMAEILNKVSYRAVHKKLITLIQEDLNNGFHKNQEKKEQTLIFLMDLKPRYFRKHYAAIMLDDDFSLQSQMIDDSALLQS
jgi:hypothetical protein